MENDDLRPESPFAVLKLKEFRLYIIQRLFFTMAMRMIATVVFWQMYVITKNPLAVAFIGLSEAVPAILLSLYSGHVVDKTDNRKLMFITTLMYVFFALVLLVISLPSVEHAVGKHFMQYAIYFTIFGTGVVRAFLGPVTNAILAQLVPKPLLPIAVTWRSGVWLGASVIGHASAGFLIAYAGLTVTFTVIITLILIASVAAFLIKPKPIQNKRTDQKTWDSVKEGLSYVLKTKELLSAMTLDLFAVLFGGTVAMIPFFAGEILKVGAIGFGWLNAATDIGSIVIIIFLTLFPLKKKQGLLLLYVVAGYGICIITFGLSTIYWLSFVALLVSGLLDGISVVIRGTILQLKTPDEMRGRVSAINSMFINSANEIGGFESGVAAKLMGVVPSVIFGGSMTLLVVIGSWFKAPSLRKFEY
ncbi:MFS transporter [Pseudoflavitalea sp. G-6-1-2]|uniref:MFS transporter n=1 Tax=Pseudoflavitalea sp. G-6-1-2 TaxID=2728841 RepID=UPI00146D7752|nr:MFS transporter [Pseudoflavitalea sp. G-6-1-2]NML21064.1 MFS transporter [Pseudoflavitalea sp. G-6-1-2]